jgi:DNA replication protein DnaC
VSPCLQRSEWLKVRALSALTIKNSEEPSHIAQAIGYELIKQGKVVLYRSIFDILDDLKEDGMDATHDRTMKRYTKCDLLIIDDMGIKQLPPKSGEYLFEIIMRRYEVRSTLMTSNRPLEEWDKLIGDVPATTAILDRFLHHAKVIKIKGNSYRLKDHARQNEPSN